MIKPILEKNVITDRALCSWVRCKRKAWLDLNEQSDKKIWSAHRALQLEHQYKSLFAFSNKISDRGLEAFKKGAQVVVGVRLKGISPNGSSLEAHPQLLQKIKGQSCWGNFSYIPVLVRQGRRLKREHRLSIALWGYLLEQLQQKTVNHGLVISLTKKKLEIEEMILTKQVKNELFDALKRLNKDISKNNQPGLTSDRKKCNLCCWKKVCDEKANQEGDLSEVSGIGAKRREFLHQIGINNITQLALTNKDYLARKFKPYSQQNVNISDSLIRQARVQKNLSAERVSTKMVLPELKSAKEILLYDIESDPDENHDFLHGFLYLKRNKYEEWSLVAAEYQPILNLKAGCEEILWGKIKSKINSSENFPILHYGETEYLSIYNLAKNQGENENELNILKLRFIDIHARLKEGWVLPVENYTLKSIAKWLNFKWTKNSTNGAKALLWWRQWGKSISEGKENSNKLKWILEYNKDDCIATWEIAKWILSQN